MTLVFSRWNSDSVLKKNQNSIWIEFSNLYQVIEKVRMVFGSYTCNLLDFY